MPSDITMAHTAADARFWDKSARKYAAAPIKDMEGYDRTVDRTRQLLRDTDTVLELGCGTGTTALKLAPHVSRMGRNRPFGRDDRHSPGEGGGAGMRQRRVRRREPGAGAVAR